MTESSKDTGVILALVERFEKQRFPHAQAIKKKVDGGGLLSEEDMVFLKEVFTDAGYIKPLVHKHPEWESVVVGAIALYREIMDKALENEKAASVGKP
jgi:hypothetical protein